MRSAFTAIIRWLLAICRIGLISICTATAVAAPSQEGLVRPLDDASSEIPLDRTGTIWSREVQTRSDSTFFRLYLTELSVPPDADLVMRIRDRNNETLITVSANDLAATRSYWTPYLSGTYALIEVENHTPRLGALSFRIANIGEEARGARLLSIQNPLDPKDQPLRLFAAKPGVVTAARSVAKLRFAKGNAMLSCTGFLVSTDLLLTNQHCFDTAPECESAVIVFGYEEDADMNVLEGEQQRCVRVEDSDLGLDFALIRLTGSPGSRWGALSWNAKSPIKNQAIYIVQHPAGRPKRVALKGCKVTTVPAIGLAAQTPTDLGHVCDTEEGSSGSPVLDASNRVIALHHLGFDETDPRWSRENRAVKAGLILERISKHIH